MKQRYKILSIAGGLGALGLLALAIALSHDSPCASAPPLAANTPTMKAIVYRCYGSPEVLKLEQIAKPLPADDRVLIKVHAASVNPLDWHYMRGTPYVMRAEAGFGAPNDVQMGVDFAGTVESIGRNVKRFKPGDAVFGGRGGAFAEYVSVAENRALALKPTNISFAQAAAVPIAAVTALQALRDKGKLQSGQRVLINGASGGVGTFAVQIAKAFGADVTGVCSTRNVALVRSLGADRVIDYTQANFTAGPQRYDLIIDSIGNHSLADYRRVMNPRGKLVMVGSLDKGRWIGPLSGAITALLVSPFVSQEFIFLLAELNGDDLAVLRDLIQAGKVTPSIDRQYTLPETAEAVRYLEQGRARGKVVVVVD